MSHTDRSRQAAPWKGPAIIVRSLQRRFGDLAATANLSFDVARSELFGIVGPDGAGKTTLLRMLAGVLRPTAGDAEVDGVSVTHHPEGVKAGIAYMPQRFGLYEDLTVRENIEFYADLYRVPAAERAPRLHRLWEFSQLEPFQNRLVGHLSGGMKQKAALCCALIHQPRILLLDEPTLGVDPISRRDLWLILHEMVVQGVTIIVSTSYLDEAERCDRVAMLHEGRLLALDTPAELVRQYPGRLLAVAAHGDRSLRDRVRNLPDVEQVYLFGDEVHVTLRAENRGSGAALFAAAGVAASDVRAIEPSLEDVFLVLTEQGTHVP